MKTQDDIFEITNEQTGKIIAVNSTKNFDQLMRDIDVSSEKMAQKAEKESNPVKKRLMQKYAKRKAEMEIDRSK